MMKHLSLALCLFLLLGCKVNQYTGKKTINFYGNKTVFPMAFQAYADFLKKILPLPTPKGVERFNALGNASQLQPRLTFSTKTTLAI